MKADAVDCHHLDTPGDDILNFLNFVAELIVGLEDLFAVFVESIAFLGEGEFLFTPLNKHGIEFDLQRGYLLADGRLSDTIDLGGLGKTRGFRQVAKKLKAFNLHG